MADAPASRRVPDGTFRADVGERTFDVVFENGRLLLNGAPADYAFERVAEGYYALRLDGQSFSATVEPMPGGHVRVTLGGRQTKVRVRDEKDLLLERFGLDEGAGAAEREVRAPMPGLVLKVLVEAGQEVEAGGGLLVLEAMKMENELRAPSAGVVAAVHAQPGSAVGKGELLVEMKAG